MKPTSLAAVAFVASLSLLGCTAGTRHRGVEVEPLPVGDSACEEAVARARKKNACNEKGVKGIRYYGRSLYLLVHSDGKGGLVWKVVSLPDPTKKMAVEPQVKTSTLETTLTFENGTLKGSKDDTNSTALPTAVLNAIQTILPSLVPLLPFDAADPKAPVRFPAPYLFKIVVRGNDVELRGGKADIDVRLTPPAPAAPKPADGKGAG